MIKEIPEGIAISMDADNENGTEIERRAASVLDVGVKSVLEYLGRDDSTMVEANSGEKLPGHVKSTIEKIFGK